MSDSLICICFLGYQLKIFPNFGSSSHLSALSSSILSLALGSWILGEGNSRNFCSVFTRQASCQPCSCPHLIFPVSVCNSLATAPSGTASALRNRFSLLNLYSQGDPCLTIGYSRLCIPLWTMSIIRPGWLAWVSKILDGAWPFA